MRPATRTAATLAGLALILAACRPPAASTPTPLRATPDGTATALYNYISASATALRLTAQAPTHTPRATGTSRSPTHPYTPTATDTPEAAPPTAAPSGPDTPTPGSGRSATPSSTPTALAGTPAQPVVHYFTAAPNPINPGDAVVLSWSAAAESVVIYRLDPQGRLTLPAHEVPLSGSLVITTPEGLRNSVNFVLYAIAGAATAQAGVYVNIRCPDTWFFANPPDTCPARPASFSTLVVQEFERGRMLWLEAERRIYILYDDVRGPRYQIRPDEWVPGMPENDPALTPPAGLFQPVRGFGVAWRDVNAPEGTRARDYLGWAIGEEYVAGSGAAQCAYASKYATCFVSGPNEVVYELKPEGSGWSVWAGP